MLPVKEIAEYARTLAARMRIRDLEEAESVGVACLAEANDCTHGNKMGYYKLFVRNKLMQHFFNCKSPCLMPENYDVEYDDEDHLANIIEGMKLTPVENKVVTLRTQGHNDPEIANIIGKSRQLVTKVRAELKRRFCDLSFLYS